MRDRPFLDGGEAPKKFSEIRRERALDDPVERARLKSLELAEKQIRELEAEAEGCSDPDQRRRLQCEAEGLRCAIAEQRGGTPL